MTENYHTHTYRCHHATGTERQYIETAIAGGITRMGFSDHAPFLEPSGKEQSYRVSMMDAPLYIQSLRQLREDYREQIRIEIGFEMEYYPVYFEQMLKTVCELGAEYLILGQHQIRYGEEDPVDSVRPNRSEQDLACYVDTVIAAMQTGVFSYVAHPDVFRFEGAEAIYTKHMRRLCRAAKQANLPLEINFLGLRDKRHYPNPLFWQIVGEEACEVVLGCDAHAAKEACDPIMEREALAMAERYHLRINPHPTLIDPATGQARAR